MHFSVDGAAAEHESTEVEGTSSEVLELMEGIASTLGASAEGSASMLDTNAMLHL